MQAAFDVVLVDIIKMIDGHLQKTKPDVIEVTGGLAKSTYVMERLRARYNPQGIIVVRPNVTNTSP